VFLGVVQLLFHGVMGEYLGRISGELNHLSLCLATERLVFAAANEPTGRVETAGA
jgi:hypothetical protein